MKTYVSAFILAVGITLSGFFIGQFKQGDRTVTVKGLAERIVKSDRAIWQIRYSATNDDLTGLYNTIATSEGKVKVFLLKSGFSANEIEVLPVSVTDNQMGGYNPSEKTKHYAANGGITLNTSAIDKVRTAAQNTGTLVQAGVVLNQSDVSYNYTSLNDIKPGMLDEATANAKKAAESFARNANSTLGTIRSASQGLFTIQDVDGSGTTATIMKSVRIVTSVQYFLKN